MLLTTKNEYGNMNHRKRGESMRKAFTTSIEDEVLADFKKSCSDIGIGMNVVMEIFMKSFAQGELELKLKKTTMTIEESNIKR